MNQRTVGGGGWGGRDGPDDRGLWQEKVKEEKEERKKFNEEENVRIADRVRPNAGFFDWRRSRTVLILTLNDFNKTSAENDENIFSRVKAGGNPKPRAFRLKKGSAPLSFLRCAQLRLRLLMLLF